MSATVRVVHGICRRVLERLEPSSVDAVVTDPPYGLAFMSAEWDLAIPPPENWEAMLRVLRPGGHLLAFGAPRTWHRLACTIEDVGFEIRDEILNLAGGLGGPLFWLRGDGNAKSRRIDKLLEARRADRALLLELTAWIAGARDRAGLTNAAIDAALGYRGMAAHWTSIGEQPTAPQPEQFAALLALFGLGPEDVPERVLELIEVLNARKGEPGEAWSQREVVGFVHAQDTRLCRPASRAAQGFRRTPMREREVTVPATDEGRRWAGHANALKPAWEPIIVGMRPLDGTFAENALEHGVAGFDVEATAIEGGGPRPSLVHRTARTSRASYGEGLNTGSRANGTTTAPRHPANLVLDEEAAAELDSQAPPGTWANGRGPSRFFYCGKARPGDRGPGNHHPTVKPTDLMRWLCALVLPPPRADGRPRVLVDPFGGSGSTALGALRAGWDEVLIVEEREDYARLAERRIREEAGLFSAVTLERAP